MTPDRKEYLRLWRLRNKERVAAYRTANLEKKRANDLAYIRSDKGKATRALYREVNRERLCAKARAWYHAHKANPSADAGTPRIARPEPDIRDQLRQEQAARQARIAAKRAQYARLQPGAQPGAAP